MFFLLQQHGVEDGHRRFLLGHAPLTTEEQSYVRCPPEEQLRAAVNKLPRIVWDAPAR